MQKLNSLKVRLKKILDFILCNILQRHLKSYIMRCQRPCCRYSHPLDGNLIEWCARCKKMF